MRRWRRVVSVAVLAVVLGAGGASAQLPIDPTAAAKLAALLAIAARLHDAYRILARVNEATRNMRNRLDSMFPNEALQEIRSVFQQVRSIQDEIQQLSCQWRFSPRIETLRLGLMRLGPLCRDQYQAVFGRPLPGIDQDLDEYRQWEGVLRLNHVRESIGVSRQWTASADELARLARQGGRPHDPDNPASVGWSMRLLAEGEALQLQVKARENATEALRLAGLQEQLDEERRADWHEKNFTAVMLDTLARTASLPPTDGQ